MAISRDLIDHVIHGRNSYCCLCLVTVDDNDALRIQDEILYENAKRLAIMDILDFVLHSKSQGNLMPYNAICRKCTKEALESYKFIKMCRENSRSLIKTMNIILSFLPLPDNIDKSCILELNLTNNSSLSHYGKRQSTNTSKKALKIRLAQTPIEPEVRACLSLTIKSEDENSIDSYTDSQKINEEKQKNRKSRIPSSEMRVDNTGFQCKTCFKTYESLPKLRQHFIRVHSPKTFQCLKCSKSYGTKGLLSKHVNISHKPGICTHCGKSYRNSHTLKTHEMAHSAKIMCTGCGRHYKNEKTFKEHVRQNICNQEKRKSNSEAQFTCDHCNKKFSQKGTLRVHIQYEHGNKEAHVCPWCNKKFFAKSWLKGHMVKHTKEKKFSCDKCGEHFVTKYSLLYHTRIHTGDKPYQCHLCERRFLSPSRRSDHLRRHHMSAKPFECEICYSKFKIMSSLVKHKKRHFNPESKLYLTEQGSQNDPKIEKI